MAVKYLMQHLKFSTKNWNLILYYAIDLINCLLMLWKSVNIYWLSTMQFLGMIQKLWKSIQRALSFRSGKIKEEKKKKDSKGDHN